MDEQWREIEDRLREEMGPHDFEQAIVLEEEKVRILMDEEFLSEREARRFLAIGSGRHPGDNREPKAEPKTT